MPFKALSVIRATNYKLFMKKFQKLSRNEMKNVTGGLRQEGCATSCSSHGASCGPGSCTCRATPGWGNEPTTYTCETITIPEL
ncbi:bacteriocin-like protein [Mucilaginibacter lutimaris]